MALKATNFKIGARLSACFGLIIALSAASTGAALWQSQKSMEATKAMLESPLAKERLLSDWLSATGMSVARATVIARSGDAGLAQSFEEESRLASESISKLAKQVEQRLDGEAERQLYEGATQSRAQYLSAKSRLMKEAGAGHAQEARKIYDDELKGAALAYHGKVKEMAKMQRDRIDQTAATLEAQARQGARLAAGLCALLVGLGIFCAVAISRGITGRLRQAVAIAATVAKGDLTSSFPDPTRDEVGDLLSSLETMNASLKDMVWRVQQGSSSIAVAASQIASGNLDLSSRTESQAASLEEAASSLEELASAVESNAHGAKQADGLAREAAQAAGRGGQIVRAMASTMDEIDGASQRIGDIIGVVDSIAFQTNILALNAAVEAARAGEQGRGFAVVASEVRALAARSAQAAKEIKALVEASAQKVGAGSELARSAGEAMMDVVGRAQKVAEVVGSITAATREQSLGLAQVNQSVAGMEAVDG